MKPKTKLECQVAELQKRLPDLNRTQVDWAFDHCIDFYGYFGKKESICFECGHRWINLDPPLLLNVDGCVCPNCHRKLKPKSSKRMCKEIAYYGLLTTFKGYQVIRFFWVRKYFRQGRESEKFLSEVCQNWISPKGKLVVYGRKVMGMSMYYDQWIFSSELEQKAYHDRNNIYPEQFYPRMKLIPELKRNGFKGDFHNFSPTNLSVRLLSDQKAETLFKAGQFNLLARKMKRNLSLDEYWSSIKICIRNNYMIEDADIWCDHVDKLIDFGMDIHNAKYVCPKNLMEDHQRMVDRANRIYVQREFEKQKEKISQYEIDFQMDKGKFVGIMFADEDIEVVVLDSVLEYLKEGTELHHCVFTNSYFKRSDSLCLSARKNDKRLETIEVSLKSMEVVQSRGLQNKATEYHDRIVQLVRKNMKTIRQVAVA